MHGTTRRLMSVFAAVVFFLMVAGPALATICIVPEGPPGTTTMPPATPGPQCTEGYVSPTEFHVIVDGLPPNTTIEIGPEHFEFINSTRNQGGTLGGERETFDSTIILNMNGTGDLDGFQRTISMQLACITDTGPRNAGDPVQTFPNEMVQLEGEIFGDPDFDQLTIRAGLNFGLPSPGQTTLTDLGGGNFAVDSFFDIAYEIEFVGAPGSLLDGMAGTTQATVRMQLGEPTAALPFMAVWGLALLGALLLGAIAWKLTRRGVSQTA